MFMMGFHISFKTSNMNGYDGIQLLFFMNLKKDEFFSNEAV